MWLEQPSQRKPGNPCLLQIELKEYSLPSLFSLRKLPRCKGSMGFVLAGAIRRHKADSYQSGDPHKKLYAQINRPIECNVSKLMWDRVMNINLTSQYVLIHALFQHMADHHYGRIVNVASVAAKVGGGLFGTSAYAVSKAGVICLTKAIAKEGAPYGISCNAVCPGYVNTPLVAAIPPEQQAVILSGNLLHRRADPKEVAILMLFYLSDLASFITGEIGDADAGATLD